jgi:hypothetical protein
MAVSKHKLWTRYLCIYLRCVCTMLQQLLQLCKLTLSSSLREVQALCGRLLQVKQCITSGAKLRGLCAGHIRCSKAVQNVGAMPDEQKHSSLPIRMIKLQSKGVHSMLYNPEIDLSACSINQSINLQFLSLRLIKEGNRRLKILRT